MPTNESESGTSVNDQGIVVIGVCEIGGWIIIGKIHALGNILLKLLSLSLRHSMPCLRLTTLVTDATLTHDLANTTVRTLIMVTAAIHIRTAAIHIRTAAHIAVVEKGLMSILDYPLTNRNIVGRIWSEIDATTARGTITTIVAGIEHAAPRCVALGVCLGLENIKLMFKFLFT